MRTPPLSSNSLASVLATVEVSVLERLFDQVPDVAFFLKDREGRYTSVNASLVERHGLQHKSQVLGQRPSDICPGDFGRIPAQQDAAVLRSGKRTPKCVACRKLLKKGERGACEAGSEAIESKRAETTLSSLSRTSLEEASLWGDAKLVLRQIFQRQDRASFVSRY